MTTIATINNYNCVNTMVINNATSRHAQVIARRTGSLEMGMMKSLLIDNLKVKLQTGVAHFWYKKINGEVREAWGTTSHKLMQDKVVGTGYTGEQVNVVKYWDCVKGAFRCLRYENLIAVE